MLIGNGGGGEKGPYLTDSQLSSLYIWTKSAISTGSPSLDTHKKSKQKPQNHYINTVIHNAQSTTQTHWAHKIANKQRLEHTHTHYQQHRTLSHLTSMTVYLWSVPSASSNSAISNSVGSSKRTGGTRERKNFILLPKLPINKHSSCSQNS